MPAVFRGRDVEGLGGKATVSAVPWIMKGFVEGICDYDAELHQCLKMETQLIMKNKRLKTVSQ